MAIGRTFTESIQKACAASRPAALGLERRPGRARVRGASAPTSSCGSPPRRRPSGCSCVEAALRRGVPVERLHEATGIDPWFLDQICARSSRRAPSSRARGGPDGLDRARRGRRVKRLGFGDAPARVPVGDAPRPQCAPRGSPPASRSPTRPSTPARPSSRPRRRTTTAPTRTRTRSRRSTRPAVVILGSGPNRIGQGVEFDYCCVHAAFALSDAGFETVMVNCNPETVSTDYDTSDRLFFEPLTVEDVRNVCDALGRDGDLAGVIVSARRPDAAEARARARSRPGIPVLGTSPDSIDLAEDRERFNALCDRARDPAAAGRHRDDAPTARGRSPAAIGYPVLVRPSYVLGGRAMQIVYDADGLDAAMAELAARGLARARGRAVGRAPGADRPLPRGRDRGRRRRAARRHRRGRHRRGDGAHRGGRRALGRLRVRDPAADARRRRRSRRSRRHTQRARRRARRPRSAQRAVRGEGRPGVRDRGEPAREPHRAVRQQGDRRAAGQGRGPGHGSAPRSPSCAPKGCCARRPTAATWR